MLKKFQARRVAECYFDNILKLDFLLGILIFNAIFEKTHTHTQGKPTYIGTFSIVFFSGEKAKRKKKERSPSRVISVHGPVSLDGSIHASLDPSPIQMPDISFSFSELRHTSFLLRVE
jgi:hypothetical protein